MADQGGDLAIGGKTVKALTLMSLKRTFDLFNGNHGEPIMPDEKSQKLKLSIKLRDEYAAAEHMRAPEPAGQAAQPAASTSRPAGAAPAPGATPAPGPSGKAVESRSAIGKLIDSMPVTADRTGEPSSNGALVLYGSDAGAPERRKAIMNVLKDKEFTSAAVSRRIASKWPRPVWHAPWKMYRVIAGHLGPVRCVAFDASNEWFVTGGGDRTVKFWDLASGQLKLTLTGHSEAVTGVQVSTRHPYMFTCGLDKTVRCWDLEQNKVIRYYHGHLSGVYSLALHPELDVLMSGGRDSVCRVWDMRTKLQVHCLSGHDQTVCSILSQSTDPQVITGSHDSTIKLWDLRKGKATSTLTYHKKGVRALAAHPTEFAFASGGADNIKKFRLPQGEFLHNTLQQQRCIINALAINEDNVQVSGGENGSLWFWDWKSGNAFQQQDSIVQPGSLESEAGILAAGFDKSGSRLVTCEADKTVKMWRQDENATPETHPIHFRPPTDIRRF